MPVQSLKQRQQALKKLKKREDLLKRTQQIISNLNQAAISFEKVKGEIRGKEQRNEELELEYRQLSKEVQKGILILKSTRELERKLNFLSSELLEKNLYLDKLRKEIDDQIQENKNKEEAALKELKKEKQNALVEINITRQELLQLKAEKKLRGDELSSLEQSIKQKNIELENLFLVTSRENKEIEKRKKDINDKLGGLNEYEKKLNLYRNRLQSYGKKLGVDIP